MANRFVQAPNHGGSFRSGQPTLIIVHSLEAPARKGLAWDLANGWIQTAPVSPHSLTDPAETVDCVRPNTIGWHCGNGNQKSVGLEVTGYAAWTSAQWLEPNAFAAVRLDAKRGAEYAKQLGIPMRWLSLNQIRNGESGFCTHADISATLGGTNHWDPGPNFPYETFMKMVHQWAGGTVVPQPNPNPQPGGPGGAQPKEWDEMASKEEIDAIVHSRIAGAFANGDNQQAFATALLAKPTGAGMTVAGELADHRRQLTEINNNINNILALLAPKA